MNIHKENLKGISHKTEQIRRPRTKNPGNVIIAIWHLFSFYKRNRNKISMTLSYSPTFKRPYHPISGHHSYPESIQPDLQTSQIYSTTRIYLYSHSTSHSSSKETRSVPSDKNSQIQPQINQLTSPRDVLPKRKSATRARIQLSNNNLGERILQCRWLQMRWPHYNAHSHHLHPHRSR